MLSPRHLEGIARDILESVGSPCPVDAFALADLCGFELRPWAKSYGQRTGNVIWYPAKARLVRQHGAIVHELGHWGLEQAGENALDESAARYLAGALLLPRAPFTVDLAATEWDLFDIQRRHPNASAEMIVCRMTQVSSATASVWDQGQLTRSYASEGWLVDLEADRELVDRVLTDQVPVRLATEAAWPIFERGHRRVVVVRRAA